MPPMENPLQANSPELEQLQMQQQAMQAQAEAQAQAQAHGGMSPPAGDDATAYQQQVEGQDQGQGQGPPDGQPGVYPAMNPNGYGAHNGAPPAGAGGNYYQGAPHAPAHGHGQGDGHNPSEVMYNNVNNMPGNGAAPLTN